ncbi:hypothetical protein NHX12_028679 [Muraenolepis orangiensis]|uniref:F-box domain-containing protein n=1 Tax=Muraenolepis orangiensis TaxID=630683 RepID=A0A9Q0ECL0_9TELE|nr:hypothetical protein NHX12_028679 [Muraenolepis orangiensis]
MEEQMETLSASLVVIRSLKRFRDRYLLYNTNPIQIDSNQSPKFAEEDLSFLDRLPVDVQFAILSLLPPEDICRLGATSRYWRAMVRDPLLWKYFLLRDMPHWPSIDHVTMPQLEALASPLCRDDLQLEERVEGEDHVSKHDYMAEYMKGHPACRQKWAFPRPPYDVVTSFLHALLPSSEPRYTMFGPGIEQLDVSMCRVNDKLFTSDETDPSGCRMFSPNPQVQEVCQAVSGFIYVANAEPGKGEGEVEAAKIRSMLSPAWGSTSRPLLVLSCVSRERPGEEEEGGGEANVASRGTPTGARCRTPSVEMAQRLRLPQLPNPWMVQDTVAESLSGLLDGISWLLQYSGLRV